MSTATPGTWHVSRPDVAIGFQTAVDAWGEATTSILRRVAATFGDTISAADLAAELVEQTGYRTTMLVGTWVAKVLGPVQRHVQALGEPPLTALVVNANGSVGTGYVNAAHPDGFHDDTARQAAAAADRLTCYRAYCEDVPADALPSMPSHWRPMVRAPRPAEKERAASTEAAPLICPTCFLEIPTTGQCTECAG